MGFFKNFVKAITNPATLITVAAAIYFAPATMIAAAGGTLMFAAKAYVISAAASAAIQSLSPKPKLPSFSDFAKDETRTKDEEQFLACDYPRAMKKMNIIYGNALCVHLGFYTQRDAIIKGKRLDDRIDEISGI